MNTLFVSAGAALKALRAQRPLIHHVTNVVTMNDCANATLAIGASPVMTWAEEEVEEMAAAAQALVLNLGTLQHWTVDSMVKAGKAAARKGIPIVLDPVGAGGTTFRTQAALRLLQALPITVIRGNRSELACLTAGTKGEHLGVDSDDSRPVSAEEVCRMARKLQTVVAVTGPIDAVSDGQQVILLENGTPLLARVTGTGCMTTSLIAAFCTAADAVTAAAAGVTAMGLSGEMAVDQEGPVGPGTFHARLFDGLYLLEAADFVQYGKIVKEVSFPQESR
ncbi:hydroxyethylthiazole kinase [uncultured Megasphaera sp.]|uniref:hydroxyethylthiazole kinase n=1 Tax=uncultured Megasphaera sp. TaxID=165188 RepID=UPI002658B632|nr:hydroxyethylthiazole kinase [uncultured Megasphaera sp.]